MDSLGFSGRTVQASLVIFTLGEADSLPPNMRLRPGPSEQHIPWPLGHRSGLGRKSKSRQSGPVRAEIRPLLLEEPGKNGFNFHQP